MEESRHILGPELWTQVLSHTDTGVDYSLTVALFFCPSPVPEVEVSIR